MTKSILNLPYLYYNQSGCHTKTTTFYLYVILQFNSLKMIFSCWQCKFTLPHVRIEIKFWYNTFDKYKVNKT